MNLYAYVGNNPLTFFDPYGLDLQIVGERLAAAIAALRAADPDVDAAFRALETSKQSFLMAGADEVETLRECCTNGFAGSSFAASDIGREDRFQVPDELRKLAPNADGWSFVSTSGMRKQGENNMGLVAFHEALHLKGIADRGDLYLDCEDAFAGEDAVRERHGAKPKGTGKGCPQ